MLRNWLERYTQNTVSSEDNNMTADPGDVVLVTGGSGFIGQHIIKLLCYEKSNLNIREIRSIDLIPFKNNFENDDQNNLELRTYVGDVCEMNSDAVNLAFTDVDCVFHCAALVNIEYPPNYDDLERQNVDATRKVVELCVKHNVKRLVHTSCASVCLVPFKGHSTFTLVINQTESKAVTPDYNTQNRADFDKSFLIPGYSSSKLRAEKIILNSNGTLLNNKLDYLLTTAIRPPLAYGEGDTKFVPSIFKYVSQHGYVYPRIAGAGGKQQLVYAGNVAWGHICAYKTLKTAPKAIAGLPVFVTDDTPINDVSRFVQKMALMGQKFKIGLSFWYIPHFLFFFLSFLIELFIGLIYPWTHHKLRFSLRAISSFTASVLMFNRLRASIHMDYVPLIDADKAMQQSAQWYACWWERNIKQAKDRKLK